MSVEVNLFLYLLNEMVEAVTPAEWRDPDHLCVCVGGSSTALSGQTSKDSASVLEPPLVSREISCPHLLLRVQTGLKSMLPPQKVLMKNWRGPADRGSYGSPTTLCGCDEQLVFTAVVPWPCEWARGFAIRSCCAAWTSLQREERGRPGALTHRERLRVPGTCHSQRVGSAPAASLPFHSEDRAS